MKTDKSDKIEKILAQKYDLDFEEAKNLNDFIEDVHDFLSEDKHYYSDLISKKIFSLTSKTGQMLLRSERLCYELKLIEAEVVKNQYKSKKSNVDKTVVDFKKNFDNLKKEADQVYAEALKIVELIQSEYEKKQPA
jgi:uncharacterized protein (DUF111 family)